MTAKIRERPGKAGSDSNSTTRPRRDADRSLPAVLWYHVVRYTATTMLASTGGLRASGRHNMPRTGGVLLVSNHLSFLDVFVLGLPLHRTLNYVARSTLFLPLLGAFIRSVGGFPIQREGMGASGLKETLRRVRDGGVVTLFPEGTRSIDGELGPLKPGISALAARTRVPILPAGIAGTFEAWPRTQLFPRPHPIWVHYGKPILPEELSGRTPDAITELIHARLLECQKEAQRNLLGSSSGAST